MQTQEMLKLNDTSEGVSKWIIGALITFRNMPQLGLHRRGI